MSSPAGTECVAGGVRFRLDRRAGAGRLLVLHGFAGHPEAWREVVDRLEAPGLVAAPFLPGHGPEPLRPEWTSFEAVIRDLVAAVRALDSGKWRLAGYSLGARLGLGMLVAAPRLWADALLVGVNPGLEEEAERAARRAEDAARARLLRKEGLEAFVEVWERLPLFDSQRALPPATLAAQRSWRLAHDPRRLAWVLETLGPGAMPDLWPLLSGIAKPVRLVVGELDTRFVGIAERAAERLPAGSLTVVPGVGHNVVLEAPEAVARLLEAGTARYRGDRGEEA